VKFYIAVNIVCDDVPRVDAKGKIIEERKNYLITPHLDYARILE